MAEDPQQKISALEKEVAQLRRALEKRHDPHSSLPEHDLLDALDIPMHVVDCELVLQHVNRAMTLWCVELGLDGVKAGVSLRSVFPFLGRMVEEEYQQVLATGERLITQEVTEIGGLSIATETQKLPVHVNGKVERIITIVSDSALAHEIDNALRSVELRYHAIVESSPMGMHMYTLTREDELILTGANPAADRILGVDHKQFAGMSLEEAFPPLQHTEIPARYREVVHTGVTWTTEQILYEDDQISGAFEVIAFRSGPRNLTVNFLEVTARLRAESERSRLLAILESTSDIVATANPDLNVLYMNKAGASLLGWSHEDVSRRLIADAHPQKATELIRTVALPSAREHGLWSGETTLLGADGSEIPVSQVIMAHHNSAGTLVYYSTVIRDLSQIRQVESSLQFQRDLGIGLGACRTLQEVLHLSLVGTLSVLGMDAGGVYLVDPETGWLKLELHDGLPNTFMEAVRDIPPDSPSSRLVQQGDPLFGCYDDIKDPTDLARNTAGLHAFAALPVKHNGRVVACVNVASYTRRETTDFEQRAAAASTTLIGEAIGRKLAEEALRRSEAQLVESQKMQAVGRLAGGVAHDFNNLLTAIQVTCELMEEEIPESTQLREDLSQIMQTSERGAILVRQLLAFGGRKPSQHVLVSLNEIVESMHKMLRRLMDENVELRVKLAAGRTRVRADPGQLEQVLVNLTVNAGEAMPNGGTLTVTTLSSGPPAEMPPDHDPARSYVVLQVQDSGMGISAETQERIFEPFFTTKETNQGTGLGLSIVYSVARQSGGFVKLRTAPNVGSTFELWLPTADADERPVDPITPSTRARLPVGNETLLIVEDDAVLLRQTARALEQYGYTVLQARDGGEALRQANQSASPIHLLLTDIMMPDTTGTQLADALSRTRSGLKVVFMSGHIGPALLKRHKAGAERTFLPKPFDAVTLVEAVRKALDS